ncbi:MAG: RNA polymerase factor sigma-54 [Deltaproteobacteria bacterium]|nr:MAG: RNA polymerase factor sigma-54 [Deltaproteobacteria bacterium]
MAIELRQQLKLAQQLIMTPQLQQAIKLLQLSRLELLDTISQELQSNPLLEETQEDAPDQDALAEERQSAQREEPTPEVTIDEKAKEDIDWEEYLGDYSSGSRMRVEREQAPELPALENRLVKKPSFDAHLLWQLHLSSLDEVEKEVGTLIIGNLDRDGYLKATVTEIAEMAKCDEDCVEQVLHLVQGFDPVGVAARNLKECLLIQVKTLSLEDELVVEILENHLHDLENKNYHAILKTTGRSPEDIQKAIEIILGLEPKPGKAFDEEEVQYISPDIFVYKVDNDFVIVLNEDGMPKLRISPFYREALSKDGNVSEQTREYIQSKLRSAAWLIKSIHQRQRTIYRVAESIIKFQRDFFEQGITHLRPLVLRDVAEDLEMHESTISRVTTNKYMHTPRGVFELKYFFNSSIGSLTGGAVASESVKERIRQLVQSEDSRKPYSDKAIVEKLREENIDIARRTVAKYRELLGILPSNMRKQPVWGTKKRRKGS